MNTYLENLIKAPYNKKALFLSLASLLLIPALVLLSLFIKIPFLITLSIFVPFLSYYLYQNGKLEYDYLYMNKELDITKVINYSRRKKVVSLQLEGAHIRSLSKIGSIEQQYKGYKVFDFSSTQKENINSMFAISGVQTQSNTLYIVELSPEMIDHFKYDFGRNMEV